MLGKILHSRKSRAVSESGHAKSRGPTQGAIEAGERRPERVVIEKPLQPVQKDARIERPPANPYVSRGALKLAAALERFQLSPRSRVCLDIGASTGGFTQVLLEQGATRVYAADVGHAQLHASLRSDRRVHAIEGVDARNLSRRHVGEPVDAIVADVSFVSLKLVLVPAFAFAAPGAWLIALVKPQFEVGQRHIGKDGIVQDVGVRERAVLGVADWIGAHRWSVLGQLESPIAAASGNREYLVAARRG